MPSDPVPDIATILYDADCGFCQACVDWLAPRMHAPHPVFHPLDSPEGRELRAPFGAVAEVDSILRIEAGALLTKSDAVIALLSDCSFPWNLARLGRLAPRRLRDSLYDLVARNRHRFSKRRCRIG